MGIIETFIDGELGFVWDDSVLPALGSLMRRLHDAAASFDYLPHAGSWIGPLRAPVETICHNDIVPWNTVYRDRMPIAVIDWDGAAPGPRAWDLAYAAAGAPARSPRPTLQRPLLVPQMHTPFR